MARVPWLRIAAVSAAPMLFGIWLSIPALQPAKQLVSGSSSSTSTCLVLCADVLEVSGTKLGCGIDLLGVPYSCRSRLLQPGAVNATYVALPTLAGLFGVSRTEGTLIRLKRDGTVVYSKSVSQQVWSALYGGWVFNAIYWPIAGIVI